MTEPRIILVPIGDPNGIGPEIAVKAVLDGAGAGARLVLVGDSHVLRHYCGANSLRLINLHRLPAVEEGTVDAIDVAAIDPADFRPVSCDPQSGRATVRYIEAAVDAVRSGSADAIVTCPHNETAINQAGIPFSGYPSLLARIVGQPENSVFLMLAGGGLRIVHATLHESVALALARIDQDLVMAACRAADVVAGQLGIGRPRIGLFGINPHAGENGLFGDEDDQVTGPVADTLRAAGLDIIGPYGGDLLLSQRDCDVYVAMFHDQGHIPIKLLSVRHSTAFAVGAGILFASVGHGSAPDIAGQNRADAAPLISALETISEALANQERSIAS